MTKCYYNGVLLPEIPAEVLAQYPYCWIRKHTTNGVYQLMLSASIFYLNGTALYASDAIVHPLYTYPIEDTTETGWTDANNTTYYGWTIDDARPCMWSNHDIPNGSATATKMYFVASPIMPEDRPTARLEYIKSIGYSYLNTGIIPDVNIEAEVTYAVDACSIYGCHVLSNPQWYFPFPRTYGGDIHFFANNMEEYVSIYADDALGTVHTVRAYPNGNIIINDETVGNAAAGSATSTAPLYLLAYGGNPSEISYTGTSRLYRCKIWQSGELVRDYIPYCQMGVPGLKERVSGQFYSSEGTLAFSAGNLLTECKHLIRSNTTLYTITDGALTTLTETEVTAGLFQTYGVDDLPDGSLLLGLTDPEVLYWHDSEDELPTLTMTVQGTPPLPQVLTSDAMDMTHESIAGINYAVVDASEDVRFAVTFDDGVTWRAFDGTSWFTVSDEAPGMLTSTFNAITAEQWAEVTTSDTYRVKFWIPSTTGYVSSCEIHYINS